jgi:2-polyprenyl-3-methyl-5-hydroxy-6-metoxy-1,4-benzoquinol methylase/spore coat polysaccharide biosynthesis predicted glycosyltransferase SpsG
MNQTSILIVPCCEEGRGGGHLNRCISLTNDLRSAGREAYLYLQENNEKINNLLHLKNFDTSYILNKNQITRPFGLIVLDRFQTPHDEILRWKKIAPVIGIDEGGKCRDYFDFLIDILIPEGFEKPSANITSCGLLELPKKRKSGHYVKNSNLKILITFGQEDAAGLGLSAIEKIAQMNLKEVEITLLKGGLNNSETPIPDYVNVLDSIPNLADHLCEYDIVITHYGITAYEALCAGTKVFLDHPTPYHKKIAKAAGFQDISKLGTLSSWLKIKEESLSDLINSFSPQVNKTCPVCGKEANKRSIARFPDRTYRRCSRCGVLFMDRTYPPPIEYGKEYFFESYKKQYGKTYLEDFPNLVTLAKRRLGLISQVSPRKSTNDNRYPPTLFDIGCAYGPFLTAAKEEGFLPFGIDPAEDAVRYVQETLSIPAVHGFFPDYTLSKPNSQLYDVAAMWYVIEHFTDCLTVLAEIKKLLKPGGLLAFSTPSFSGVSGRKSLREFLENSPADHFTIWSPKMCKKALALAGFKVKKTTMSGCHPERFPLLGKFAADKNSRLYSMLMTVSRIFALGDTFEVYAKKNN